ncbi:ABC transporter ATP-binding protein [Desulfosarcina alkanivorans]|uniref:ABC transporter ATP-binding protein n=1 Tax=Desulfosarcina alkanivorans TaxID=571177 RepID=A0A5K7YPR1_9BACT|nr:ABC transporter ATP-binding protein [Desulfosarcina alkanivorans]BBO68911.1 ABC transporter ATP-binding protein [Desulfosarcina alkanivorans]
MLELRNVSKWFGGLPALQDVSFRIPRGQVTALIGPNGAGKSTLINCISGVDNAQAGSIRLARRPVEALPAHDIAALGVARTFQNLKLFGRLTVLDNVLTGLTVAAERSFIISMLRLPGLRHEERQLRLRALDALDDFGLSRKAQWPASALSYGEKKRVEMARAFVSDPRLVLLDEPVAGLNADETARIARHIRRQRGAGHTMLLVEHDMALVMDVADQVVVLDSGRCIACGDPADVRSNPLVLEAYLGRMEATA